MNFVAALAQLLTNGLGLWSELAVEPAPPTAETDSPALNFQIDAPPTDYGAPVYTQELLNNEFGASWGRPFSVDYEPPDIDFSHVTLLLEVSSFGIQYDRLAHVYLNSVEIWRPSTSEPRGRDSYSNVTKDVSHYLSLLRQPGEISFELNNLVTERLNGTFNVTLSAQYFSVDPAAQLSPNTWFEHEGAPASRIASVLEPQVANAPVFKRLQQLPRNTTRAVLQVFASGNGNDEFWYAQSGYTDEDGNTGPLRHIVVEINGELAGTISPFYQIYTGGFQPALWSPFVAPNAYDVPAYEIDVSPFLPLLWDRDTLLELAVKDLFDKKVHHEWIISASLFTWEVEGVEGTGTRTPSQESNSTNKVYIPGIEVATFSQELNVSADLQFNNGPLTHVAWYQTRSIDASIVGGTVISHSSSGQSLTSYATRNYSRAHQYDIALALDNDGIVVAEGYRVHDAGIEPSSSDDLLSRSHSVQYNGSWFTANETQASLGSPMPDLSEQSAGNSRQKVNGSDVFVRLRDPLRLGAETHKQHAISRNGSVVALNVSSQDSVDALSEEILESNYLSDLICNTFNGGGVPLTRLTDAQLQDRQRIRRKWLKHGI